MADVDALLASMTADQLAGWSAFAELEPFGPLRDDQRAAATACAIANSIPFRGKGARALRTEDIFASLAPPVRRQTPGEMAAIAKAATIRSRGTVAAPLPKSEPGKARPNEFQARRPGNRDRGRPERSGVRPR